MNRKNLKRSGKIALPLIASGLLGGCFELDNNIANDNYHNSETTLQRDVYATKEDCMKDWQEDKLCQEQEEKTDDYGNTYLRPIHSYTSSNNAAEINHTMTDAGTTPSTGNVLGAMATGAVAGYAMNKMLNNEEKRHHNQTATNANGASAAIVRSKSSFYGPQYDKNNRSIKIDGKVISPTSNNSMKVYKSYSVPKGAATTTRGGFTGKSTSSRGG